MKNIFTLTLLIAAFCFSASAQTAPNDGEIVRAQLVSALERSQKEVKASRKLVDGLKEQIESKEARIKALNGKDELSQKAIAGLQSEIINLRLAITEAETALEVRRTEVVELKKQLDSTRNKLARARSFTKYLAVAAGVLAAIVVIK